MTGPHSFGLRKQDSDLSLGKNIKKSKKIFTPAKSGKKIKEEQKKAKNFEVFFFNLMFILQEYLNFDDKRN